MIIRRVFTRRSKFFWVSFGVCGGFTGYSVVFDTNSFRNLSHFIDSRVFYNISEYLFNPLESWAKSVRVNVHHAQNYIAPELDSFQEQESKNDFYQSGKLVIEKIIIWIKEFVRFLVVDLIPTVKELGTEKTVKLMQDYVKPAKHLLSRPTLERLQSGDNRLDQYVKAIKSKNFWKSIPVMHSFYIEFKDQIDTLSDEELSEIIDIYLDNPDLMLEKVKTVLEALKDDKGAKSKFNKELVMNFVRGENIDDMKREITAFKTADTIVSAFQKIGLSESPESSTFLRNSIESVVSSVISFFHW